jgi:hypothetical protein
MYIADDSSKVKGVKAVFIRISSNVNIQKETSEQSSARLYFWWKWKDDSFLVSRQLDKTRYVINIPVWCIVLRTVKYNYDMIARNFAVQINGFMSLTSYFDVKYRY